MVTQFGARRIFVNLEGRSDPLDILILLARELGLKPEPNQNSTLAAIRYNCQEAPAFAILDNAEKLAEENQSEAVCVLGLIANIPNLSILVTSRVPFEGLAGWEAIHNLPSLPPEEARALFLSIATAISSRTTPICRCCSTRWKGMPCLSPFSRAASTPICA
jgi:hypothetical protein